MQRQGATEREACDNFWVADYRGLVTSKRADLSDTVAPFARQQPGGGDTEGEALADVVHRVRNACSSKKLCVFRHQNSLLLLSPVRQ